MAHVVKCKIRYLVSGHFTLGKEYNVLSSDTQAKTHRIIDDTGAEADWDWNMFYTMFGPGHTTNSPAIEGKVSQSDLDRCLDLGPPFIHNQSEECPCKIGISRRQCQYHKGT